MLASFLQRRLDPSRYHALEAHIQSCSACRSVVTDLSHVRGFAPDPHGPTMRSPAPNLGPSGTLQVEELSSSTVPKTPGTPIGRYIVEETLGEGGMGVVLRAHDPVLARPVALKLIRPELVARREIQREVVERLLIEARAMATLNHPNVVTVYDAGKHGNTVFIAMEFVPGQTLEGWLKIPRPADEILAAFAEAAAGLQAAHDAGILHRDFKPQNVLVGPDGRMRVTDFGLARSARQRNLTAPGAVMGTPAYMSPEQLFGQPVDPRSDQFSFCVALWEALYGRRPFEGGDLDGLRWAMMNRLPTPPPSRQDLPRVVEQSLTRGLAIAPTDRFASLRKLIEVMSDVPDPEGGNHIRIHQAAQSVFSLMHVGVFGWTISQAAGGSSSGGSDDMNTLVVVIAAWMLVVVLFSLAGVFWAPLNAYGLYHRASWARRSTLIYGICSLFTLIGIPYGAYAIYSLRRPDVRELFAVKRSPGARAGSPPSR